MSYLHTYYTKSSEQHVEWARATSQKAIEMLQDAGFKLEYVVESRDSTPLFFTMIPREDKLRNNYNKDSRHRERHTRVWVDARLEIMGPSFAPVLQYENNILEKNLIYPDLYFVNWVVNAYWDLETIKPEYAEKVATYYLNRILWMPENSVHRELKSYEQVLIRMLNDAKKKLGKVEVKDSRAR